MKKGIAIFFVFVLLINLCGYFISFQLQRANIRKEISGLIKAEKIKHIQQFVFTIAEYKLLKTYEAGREFALNGLMYDVISKKIVDGKIILTAYCDKEETNLLEKFVAHISSEIPLDKSRNILPVFSLLEFVFTAQQWQWYNPTLCFFIHFESSNLLSQFLTSETPPPDFTLS